MISTCLTGLDQDLLVRSTLAILTVAADSGAVLRVLVIGRKYVADLVIGACHTPVLMHESCVVVVSDRGTTLFEGGIVVR